LPQHLIDLAAATIWRAKAICISSSNYTWTIMVAADKRKYCAFVSYSHADAKWARWMQRELETYRIPKSIVRESGLVGDTLRPVFRDTDELGSTPDLPEAIRAALTDSDALIVVCSTASSESDWVNREIEYFLALSPDQAKRVFCLLVSGNVKDDIADVLPGALAGYEGLAADLRKGGDGPKRAKLKLVSALIGVNLDRLVQRDRTRRRRRAAILGTVATGLTVLIAVLSHQSRLSSLEAEEKARVADELVTYMLKDLKKRLDEFDGVAKLDPGFDAALAYFEGLAPEDMDVNTLERYFDALTSAGDLRLREGKSVDALRIWERSLEISGRLVERDPTNANSWRRHGDAFVSLALARWEDPEEIVLNTKKALVFFEKAAEIDSEDFRNYGIQVATLNNLGAGYTRLRDFNAARNTFLRSLALNEDLRSRTWPESESVRARMLRQEAESAGWMTEVELHLGRPEAAIEWHEREITIRRREVSNSGNPVRLGDALKWGAAAYESIGDDLTGRSKRIEARQLFERLMQRDPANFYWQRRYIEVTLQLTMTDIQMGYEAAAREVLADIEPRLGELASQHTDNVAVARMVTRKDIAYALLWVDSSTKLSLEYASRGMSRLEPNLQVDGAAFETVIMHAEAAALAAYAMIIEGMATQGKELARKEIRLVERRSGGSDYLHDKQVEVILLWLAGEQQRGDALYAEMRDRGYRSKRLDRWQERLQQKELLSR
jgi:tetratricopeptide (TPR) repeat protein